MVNTIDNIHTCFIYKGSMTSEDILDSEPIIGQVYTASDTGKEYVATGQTWMELGEMELSNHTGESVKEVRIKKCPTCGATLPLKTIDTYGMCRCEYCKNDWYVW